MALSPQFGKIVMLRELQELKMQIGATIRVTGRVERLEVKAPNIANIDCLLQKEKQRWIDVVEIDDDESNSPVAKRPREDTSVVQFDKALLRDSESGAGLWVSLGNVQLSRMDLHEGMLLQVLGELESLPASTSSSSQSAKFEAHPGLRARSIRAMGGDFDLQLYGLCLEKRREFERMYCAKAKVVTW